MIFNCSLPYQHSCSNLDIIAVLYVIRYPFQYSLSYTCYWSLQFLFKRKTYHCSSNELCSSYNHIISVRPHLDEQKHGIFKSILNLKTIKYTLSLFSLGIKSPKISSKNVYNVGRQYMQHLHFGTYCRRRQYICRVKISSRQHML